jgi:hypothetical protein
MDVSLVGALIGGRVGFESFWRLYGVGGLDVSPAGDLICAAPRGAGAGQE